jgi:hypothetical protein
MSRKWKKIALVTAPLLMAGSVYAFATASASNTDSGITGTLISSEAISEEELKALESAKPAPVESADGASDVDMEAINPFTVYTPQTPATGSDSEGGAAQAPAQHAAQASAQNEEQVTFSLENVKHLELKTKTTLGELKLEWKSEDGEHKLEGKLGDRKIEVEGEPAQEVLSKLLESLGLQDSITALLKGEQVKLPPALAGALQELEIELADGRKIETNEHPGNSPKAEGGHDNGKHKGWEKQKKKEKKEKEDKGKGHGVDKDEVERDDE